MKKILLAGGAFVANVMIIITCEAMWMVIEGNPLTMESWETMITSIEFFTLKAVYFWVAVIAFAIACKLTYTVVDKLVDPVCDAAEEVKCLFCDDANKKIDKIS